MKKLITSIFAILFAISAQAQVLWTIPNITFSAGDTVEAEFHVYNFDSIASFSYTMRHDTAFLERMAVTFTGAMPNFGINNFSFHGPGYANLPGEIRTLRSQATGTTVEDGSHIYTIRFRAKQAGSLSNKFWLWANHPILKPRAYKTPPLTSVGLSIAYTETSEGVASSTENKAVAFSVASYPNPIGADGTANVFVSLPEPAEMRINVVDSAGYVVFGGWYRHGGGTESFDIDIPFSGVHYLQVTVGNKTITKTIVKQ